MKANSVVVFTLLFMLSIPRAEAQANDVQNLKTRNNDLRVEHAVFELKSHSDDFQYSLFSSGDNQYFVDYGEKNKRVKVSSQFAEKVDTEFVKNFIEIKYGMNAFQYKVCKEAFTLVMRGEEHRVCDKEKEKLTTINKMVKSLKSQLKKLR